MRARCSPAIFSRLGVPRCTPQNRPLDAVYPVVFFDAFRVKIRDEGLVRNKTVYVALAITCEGDKEVLGLWIEQTEGARFWLKVMNELHARGVGDTGSLRCAAPCLRANCLTR